MIKHNKNGATLEDLANMVAKGFENTATKDDLKELSIEMNTRFSAMDKRLGKVEYQVDEVYDILKLFE